MCKRTPDPSASPDELRSPDGLRLPLGDRHIEAAKETVADNKGAQWVAAQEIGLLIGGNAELKVALARFLWELEGVPTATISGMTGLSGQELREIAILDPISVFRCLGCDEESPVWDRRDHMRLSREHRVIYASRAGDAVLSVSLCQRCTEARLQTFAEESRIRSLAQRARIAQLKKMSFAEYRRIPEWQVKRTQMLMRAGYRCQTCGERDARLDVHHNTYERYGDESVYDLVVLCEQCHQLFHGGLEDAS